MRLRAGMHGAQGWRPTMEDEEICELELNRAFNLSGFPEPHAFFAVLDGHCGNMTSRYARDHLAKNVASHPFFGIDARQAFISGFQKTDEELRAVEETESGSTCCSVLIRGDEVFCANLGRQPCRAVRGWLGCGAERRSQAGRFVGEEAH
eukprot:EC796229.1.p1 GENE.EC796229.1~~EC796229.1.p1  ORF type:complete len:150 (+),score=38.31 EC796229.1:55-504(+)